MEEWREIKNDITEVLDYCDSNFKVRYCKPKEFECSHFRITFENPFVSQYDIEEMLEETMEQYVLDADWESDTVLILEASWDSGDDDGLF